MPIPAWPYSRLNEGMKPQERDDDPSHLPETKPDNYPYPKWHADNVEDATEDVGAAGWAESETFRRINCRGKD